MRKLAAFSVAALIAVACDTAPDDGNGAAASGCKPDIETIQQKVFLPRCTMSGCHGTATPGTSLDLASPDVQGRLVDKFGSECPSEVLVVPGNAAASFLVRKLSDARPSCGSRMPAGRPALAQDDIKCIEEWIAGLPASGTTPEGGTGGGDASVVCAAGETACGTVCTDTKTDAKNCGTCGTSCPASAKFCTDGSCSATCSLTDCSGSCVDTQKDPRNCGSCGKACDTGKVCSAGACTCGTKPLYKTQIEQAIFGPNCATSQCHGRQTAPPGSLDLRAGKSYAELVNVKSSAAACSSRTLVTPGNVAVSYLIDKLRGTAGICGSQMPKTGGISAAELAQVEGWICNGAAND